ncbi:MAG TPA: DUF202 domain-containing protein [Ktedonosporobacter sp.]|jgi:putative membrane protein|nr:DUF202 domain-containing protein [Ktedonosporobacter sp.]
MQKDGDTDGTEKEPADEKRGLISKKVTDHLANERTFLAWIRTGLATITFGFVIARFGLLLRELTLKNATSSGRAFHYSALIGVALTVLGVMMMIFALFSFFNIRRSIDNESFHPSTAFTVVLTVLASLIGLVLAAYLWFTA